MHDVPLILTLTGGLSATLVLGYIAQRLGLSPIAGYLLAGTLVGPHTPEFMADTTIAERRSASCCWCSASAAVSHRGTARSPPCCRPRGDRTECAIATARSADGFAKIV